MAAGNKVVLHRENSEPSPKVAVPSLVTLVVAVVWSVIVGEVDPEQVALAAAAVVQFVLGFLKTDSVDYEDLIDALEHPEAA